jgi:hypothetical protein
MARMARGRGAAMSRGLERKVLALAEVCRLAHQGLLSSDCCVYATRTGLTVLERWGIKAKPLLCNVTASNREAAYGDPTKPTAWSVAIDCDQQPQGIAGHLVIVGKVGSQKFLLDLSAYQMNRPGKGIHIRSGVAARAAKPFTGNWRLGLQLEEDGALVYSRHPAPEGVPWASSPNWTLPTARHRATAAEVVARLRILSARTLHLSDVSDIEDEDHEYFNSW